MHGTELSSEDTFTSDTIIATVTAAFAFPAEQQIENPENIKQLPVKYYQFICNVTPQHTVKADVATNAIAARAYIDGETKPLKIWHDNKQAWIVWSSKCSLNLNKDAILKLFSHVIEVKVFLTKDKQVKGITSHFEVSHGGSSKSDDEERITENQVLDEVYKYINTQQPTVEQLSDINLQVENPDKKVRLSKLQISGAKKHKDSSEKIDSGWIPCASSKQLYAYLLKRQHHFEESFSSRPPSVNESEEPAVNVKKTKHKKRTGKDSVEEEKEKKEASLKQHIASIYIDFYQFFSGEQSFSNCLKARVEGLDDIFVTVSLNKKLLPRPLKKLFNPLIFKVLRITDLPNSPHSYQELQQNCQPVYVSYKFFHRPVHKTEGRLQQRNLFWNDVYIVLAGLINEDELKEYLRGPPLIMEIHDRDSMTVEPVAPMPVKRQMHFASEEPTTNEKRLNHYGIASFDLQDFLKGASLLNMVATVLPSPDTYLQPSFIAPGSYLEAGTFLEIRIEITIPLLQKSFEQLSIEPEPIPQITDPMSRIVFIIHESKHYMVEKLQAQILKTNHLGLGLDSKEECDTGQLLSKYKLSLEESQSMTLDYLTGFHILLDDTHIMVVEGLRNLGISNLWQLWTDLTVIEYNKTKNVAKPGASTFYVLYNSDFHFSFRMYSSLGVELFFIHLKKPFDILQTLSKHPEKEEVYALCLKCLTNITSMITARYFHQLTKRDLFPTTDMLQSLSSEIAIH